MVELRPILVGFGVLLTIGALAVALFGLLGALPTILAAGVVGGAVTGWIGGGTRATWASVQQGGFLGLYASGLGGVVVFAVFLAVDVAAMAGDGDVLLLFVASPLAFVLFALEGLIGGYLGSGLRVLYLQTVRGR